MAEFVDCGPLWACSDCAQLIANDEATDSHREQVCAWQSEYGDDAHLVIGDDVEDFSRVRCDGCGTTDAGTRFELFALI